MSQNPAIEANSRQAEPKLQQQTVKYFGSRIEELFDVVLIELETQSEKPLVPRQPGGC